MFRGAQDPKERKAAANGNGQPRRKHGAQYYIISNEAYADAPQPSVTKVPRSPPKHVSRDFNILTNKFHDRHDERFEAEHAHAKDVAAVKFFKTHDYDAVRGRYFDDSKEIEFVDKRKAEQQAHGKDRVFSLPPREQFSEGRLYNILNQQVINPDKLDTVKEKSQRALNKIQKTAFEQRMRQLGEFEMNRTEELCLNRFANQRQAQMYIHGYDPISNQSYIGRNAKQIPPIRADATKNAWEVLTKSVEKSQQRAITAAPTPREGGIGANSVKTPNGHKIQVHKPNVLVVDQLATTSDSRDNTTFRPVRTGGFPTISHA
ncbi:TPA: hypothetical protein N0F65_002704 [Lagenidium giganteum]|uniref:Uncharacterized protein n=1 Tax=Lagenidium giganteum TaxID=4803 RepID=A0AAV2YZK1_9STRA|nr:TPA: hypothetical protein N0F65_002704 [Lagenidium giganteum]